MNVSQAIRTANEQMPNTVDDSTKIDWLKKLDMQITDEIVNTHVKPSSYKVPEFEKYDMQTNLIVDEIHSELYVTYLKMKIAMVQVEAERYQMELMNYNNAILTYRNYYNRKHMPLGAKGPRYR